MQSQVCGKGGGGGVHFERPTGMSQNDPPRASKHPVSRLKLVIPDSRSNVSNAAMQNKLGGEVHHCCC